MASLLFAATANEPAALYPFAGSRPPLARLPMHGSQAAAFMEASAKGTDAATEVGMETAVVVVGIPTAWNVLG